MWLIIAIMVSVIFFKYIFFYPTSTVHVTDLQIYTLRQVNVPAFFDLSLVTCTSSQLVWNNGTERPKYPEFFFLSPQREREIHSFFQDHFSLVFRKKKKILLCNGCHLFSCKQSYKSTAKLKDEWQNTIIRALWDTVHCPLGHTNHSWLIIMCLSIRQQIIIYLSRVVVQTCKCVSKCFRQGKCVTAPFLDIW